VASNRFRRWSIERSGSRHGREVTLLTARAGQEAVSIEGGDATVTPAALAVVVVAANFCIEHTRAAILDAEFEWPDAAILLAGAPDDPRWLATAVRCGAKGAVPEGCASEELQRAADAVAEGELWFSRRTLREMLEIAMYASHLSVLDEMATEAGLTEREREVAELVVNGLSNKDIARRLKIAEPTVKVHVHHAFGKLHVRTRGELMVQTTIAPPPGTGRY
jgi:DNA-binding NarL/FixJ family response regulator